MAYSYPIPPRWPVGRGPFDIKRTRDQAFMPFVVTNAVVGRSRTRYVVSSQKPNWSGWSLNVVVPDPPLDLWLSYIDDKRSRTRLVQEFYLGPLATPADRDRVLGDFGLRSTLRASNV